MYTLIYIYIYIYIYIIYVQISMIIINCEMNDAIRKYRYKSLNMHWLMHDM